MSDNAHQDIHDIADHIGWSDFAFVLPIASWVDETGQARTLLDYWTRSPPTRTRPARSIERGSTLSTPSTKPEASFERPSGSVAGAISEGDHHVSVGQELLL